MNEKESPAKGTRGFLLYNPFEDCYWFRVYSEDKKSHIDYKLVAEDIEVEILSSGLSLYDSEGKSRLDYKG